MKDDPRLALAFAQTLLQLLDSLPEPVIPISLHARCAQATSRDEAFEVCQQQPYCCTIFDDLIQQLLDELPSEAVNVKQILNHYAKGKLIVWLQVWISITAFVHFIGQQTSAGDSEASPGKTEHLGARNLLITSGPCLS
jgi:phosphatidylinositol-bisphosphatase